MGPSWGVTRCCHGTGVENFAKLADSVYFHDGAGIWVNLFVPSAVTWRAKGMILSQETRFPESDTTTLMVRMTEPIRMPLRVRVPYWVADGGSAKLNGRPLDAFAAPGSYLVLDRVWRDGDRLEVRLPMALHAHAMPDDSSVQAVMFGPLVLAGRLGTDGITAENRRAEPTKPRRTTCTRIHGAESAAGRRRCGCPRRRTPGNPASATSNTRR